MSFQRYETEDRRLQTLRLLEQSTGYSANAYLLGTALQGLGHHISYDRVIADVEWLAEQDLVTLERVGGVTVATLTTRGGDVATGRTRVSGIKRPQPGE
ncbi:ArsR family transcriptional regulator [Salinicola sp. JS01]|uniref:VpaChn25_0724 family phage protein n=1 Tax=Salinicola sp. JS01 TaxID=3050071 RepID=UPI00255B737A|nr:ArsR family transcriptional regulator [Salinicola sp. JS01]WIX31237.1 ArsR family transcriptional regulator [Salinicola sp. JS01]